MKNTVSEFSPIPRKWIEQLTQNLVYTFLMSYYYISKSIEGWGLIHLPLNVQINCFYIPRNQRDIFEQIYKMTSSWVKSWPVTLFTDNTSKMTGSKLFTEPSFRTGFSCNLFWTWIVLEFNAGYCPGSCRHSDGNWEMK